MHETGRPSGLPGMERAASSSRPDGARRAAPVAAPGPDPFTIPLNWRRWWAIIPEIVALACTGLLPLIVGANVVARYTDWFRILWAEDVVKVLFVWIIFLGGAIAVKYQAHVRMTMLIDRAMPGGRARAAWARVIRLSPMVVGAILLVLGVRQVEISMHRELPTLQITAGYFSTIIPASGALMILYAALGLRASGRRSDPPQ